MLKTTPGSFSSQQGVPRSFLLKHHSSTVCFTILTANTTFPSIHPPPSCGVKDSSLDKSNLMWLSRSRDGVEIVFGMQNPESRHRSCGGVLWFPEGCFIVFACAKIGDDARRQRKRKRRPIDVVMIVLR
jgi:hypothetical protein